MRAWCSLMPNLSVRKIFFFLCTISFLLFKGWRECGEREIKGRSVSIDYEWSEMRSLASLSNVIAVRLARGQCLLKVKPREGSFPLRVQAPQSPGVQPDASPPLSPCPCVCAAPAVRWHEATVIQERGRAKNPGASEESCQEGCQHLQRETDREEQTFQSKIYFGKIYLII